MQGLILHCGASRVEREEIDRAPLPMATLTHHPIAHSRLLGLYEKALVGAGFEVSESAFALSRDGNNFFGMLELANGIQDLGYRLVASMRNSHTFKFAATAGLGNKVTCCDNLAWYADITAIRKHTRYISRDLPILVDRVVGRFADKAVEQDQRIEAYKAYDLSDGDGLELLFALAEKGTISDNKFAKACREWKAPQHDEFKARNVWSVFNSLTEVYKGTSVWSYPRTSQAFFGHFDGACGLLTEREKAEAIEIEAEVVVTDRTNPNWN